MQGSEFVRMEGIKKVYPDGTVALRGVDLVVRKGEILGLLGENGAGKTTLMKILTGVLPMTEGRIIVEGRPVRFKSPADSLSLGIGMVHQHFTLIPNFTVVDNIILGIEDPRGTRSGLLKPIDYEHHRRRLEELMRETGVEVPLDVEVQNLPLGLRQRAEILKALYRGVKLLILDEPTTFLTPLEVEELFKTMRRLRDQGNSVIFISHKIKEALTITDRIVVLRRGQVVGEIQSSQATPETLGEMMVGKRMTLEKTLRAARPSSREKPALKVEELVVKNELGGTAVKGVSFNVYPGEIYGIAGVEGNGQDELVEVITGLRSPVSGRVLIGGQPLSEASPIEAYKRGVSHIPGDRDRYGLVLEFTVKENSIVSRQWEPGFNRGGRLDWGRITKYAWELVRRFNIVTPGVDTPAKSLSGGNRQKLVVGRELSKEPSVIVAVHPTRGLDIASTMYIRETLARYRDEGKAVLLVSADLDEILQLSDRIGVMYEGKIIAELPGDRASREEIGVLMGGVESTQDGQGVQGA